MERVMIAVALVFHAVGLIGIGILGSNAILSSTPLHLLLMSVLLLISFRRQLPRFACWAGVTAVVSFWAEWLGVHTGLLFGNYGYGDALGIKFLEIPLVIGLNWVAVVAGACSISERIATRPWVRVLLAAALATGYDWIMEPVAVKLDYWSWAGAAIPLFNYLCWAGFAAAFATLWQICGLRGNIFASGLFVIQVTFFILLRILL